jgi:hypothetical protein
MHRAPPIPTTFAHFRLFRRDVQRRARMSILNAARCGKFSSRHETVNLARSVLKPASIRIVRRQEHSGVSSLRRAAAPICMLL